MPDFYTLSKSADIDLENILEYGIDEYRLENALVYYDKLILRLSELVDQPFLYQEVNYIRAGYRRSVCGIHSIYYRINHDEIFIIRILHNQDSESLYNAI